MSQLDKLIEIAEKVSTLLERTETMDERHQTFESTVLARLTALEAGSLTGPQRDAVVGSLDRQSKRHARLAVVEDKMWYTAVTATGGIVLGYLLGPLKHLHLPWH